MDEEFDFEDRVNDQFDAELAEFGLAGTEAQLLLDLSEVAIRACLEGTHYPGVDRASLPPALLRPCGAFVSLHVSGSLNGCIGNVDSTESLGICVTELAIKAAFEDPRLPALQRHDLTRLSIEVSLLSDRRSVPATSRSQLLEHVHREVHGLVIRSGHRQALFLPSVWEQLPQPDSFIDQLFHKAGLEPDEWPDDLSAEVFTTASFSRQLS